MPKLTIDRFVYAKTAFIDIVTDDVSISVSGANTSTTEEILQTALSQSRDSYARLSKKIDILTLALEKEITECHSDNTR